MNAFHKPWLWCFAGVVSLGLFTLVVMQVDFAQAKSMIANISWAMMAAAFAFLLLEGITTALRLWLFAAKRPCLGQALKANAWYVLLLVILPARLGEVAAVVVLERYLGQKYAAAAMSIVAQRLYDVIILGVIFLIALLGLGDFIDKQIMAMLGVVLIAAAIFVLFRLDLFLTWAAMIFRNAPKKLYRLILQARLYTRHCMNMRDVPMALLLTIFKWISNLGALVCLLMALRVGLGMFEYITVAAAYNFLAIIPLQSIGGIGVGEAGLTLLLVGMGLTTSMAAGVSLVIRFVILVFPFIFWVLVMGVLKAKDSMRESAEI